MLLIELSAHKRNNGERWLEQTSATTDVHHDRHELDRSPRACCRPNGSFLSNGPNAGPDPLENAATNGTRWTTCKGARARCARSISRAAEHRRRRNGRRTWTTVQSALLPSDETWSMLRRMPKRRIRRRSLRRSCAERPAGERCSSNSVRGLIREADDISWDTATRL